EARPLLNFVEHEGQQHEVAARGRHRHLGVAGLEHPDVAESMLCYAAAHGGEHLALDIRRVDMTFFADDARCRDSEEAWAATNIRDGLPRAQSEAMQELRGLERLMPRVAEQKVFLSSIEFGGHGGLLV